MADDWETVEDAFILNAEGDLVQRRQDRATNPRLVATGSLRCDPLRERFVVERGQLRLQQRKVACCGDCRWSQVQQVFEGSVRTHLICQFPVPFWVRGQEEDRVTDVVRVDPNDGCTCTAFTPIIADTKNHDN